MRRVMECDPLFSFIYPYPPLDPTVDFGFINFDEYLAGIELIYPGLEVNQPRRTYHIESRLPSYLL